MRTVLTLAFLLTAALPCGADELMMAGDFYPWGINCPVAVMYKDGSYCCNGSITYPLDTQSRSTAIFPVAVSFGSCKQEDMLEIRVNVEVKP